MKGSTENTVTERGLRQDIKSISMDVKEKNVSKALNYDAIVRILQPTNYFETKDVDIMKTFNIGIQSAQLTSVLQLRR